MLIRWRRNHSHWNWCWEWRKRWRVSTTVWCIICQQPHFVCRQWAVWILHSWILMKQIMLHKVGVPLRLVVQMKLAVAVCRCEVGHQMWMVMVWKVTSWNLKHLIKDMIFWDFASGCLSPVLMMDEYTDGKLKQYFSYFTGFSQCYPLFHNETKRKLG